MGHGQRHSAKEVIKLLIRDDGWKGLYRGLGPRFFSMSAWGTSMILAYEYLSKFTYLFFFSPWLHIIFYIFYPCKSFSSLWNESKVINQILRFLQKISWQVIGLLILMVLLDVYDKILAAFY